MEIQKIQNILALWPGGLGNYFVCKRFAVQTLLWSLEFVIQINLKLSSKLKYLNIKVHIFFNKKLILSIDYSKCGHEYEKIFKEEGSVEILKILGLINNIDEYQKIYNHA